ncbi:MAG: hypothetical protein U0528_13905 [Anaerolineae bacterium]
MAQRRQIGLSLFRLFQEAKHSAVMPQSKTICWYNNLRNIRLKPVD